jgi:hypothetical protein
MLQLVLQFRPWANRPLADLVALEQTLAGISGLVGEIDGHDIGVGEANIFIFTADPLATMHQCLLPIELAGLTASLGAGYREVGDEHYVRVWPVDERAEFSIR